MSFAEEMLRRLRTLVHHEELDRDLEEEMNLHLQLRQKSLEDRGHTPEAARRAAHLKFGNVTRIKEKSRMVWGSEAFASLKQDVSYGIRGLWRSRALTFVALLSLALGIGATTAIFSFLDAVMLRSLPVKAPGELVLLGEGRADGIGNSIVNSDLYSYPFYRQLRDKNAVFSDVAAISSMTNDVHGFVAGDAGQLSAESQLMHVTLVSGSYFPMLGVQAQLGRTLNEADDNVQGEHPVVVISQAFWKRAFAEDPQIVGRKLKLGTTIFSIVGVAPAEFFGTKVGELPDMWAPLAMTKSIPPGWDMYTKDFSESLDLIGRLKPGVSLQQATANVNLLVQQITRGFSDVNLSQKNVQQLEKTHIVITPMATGLSEIRSEFSEPLKILMAVVVLVLLIACANIANLLLARSTVRARELAVRQALGARRTRLIRQLLTESMILALTGGALGVGVAAIANHVLLRMVSSGEDTLPLNVAIDVRLLAFSFAITVATALLFGTIPAFRATRTYLADSLRDGRGPSNAGARNPLAKILVVSQVAVTLVLMVAAGLFLHTLVNLNRVDPGFDREHVLRLNIDSNFTGIDSDDPRLNAMFADIESRVNALPGVKAASFSAFTFNEGVWSDGLVVPGKPENDKIQVIQNVVGDGYFSTMQISLLAGRTFTPADTKTSKRVAVVSERIARTMLRPGNPIGQHFLLSSSKPGEDIEVIGIVKDVKAGNMKESPVYINYLPYRQSPWSFGDFEVRYNGDFDAIANSVRRAIREVNSTLPISHLTTLDEQVARTMIDQRLVAQLSGFFGILAAFLSCIGIYGLMSYSVSRRTNEIGIRMALGAGRDNVRWLVMRETALLVVVGVAIGIPVAWFGSRSVEKMLYGLHGADVLSMSVAVVLLLSVAMAAGYLPARRASKVDPIVALRYE